jgi:hypothetical protein
MSSVASFFSASYAEARAKVLAAADAAGAARLASHDNPNRGPDGGALATDVVRIGPAAARKLLVLVSSTHGIEGYCGSGCQVGWLAKRHYWRDSAPDTAVVLVHAINPFGFAWGRRVTEENVDLNRNFVDFDAPRPANPDYEALAEHINPSDWTPSGLAAHDAAIARFYGRPNADFLPRAIHAGQYVNDKGTFFGGFAPTWARRTFETIARDHLAGAEELCLIDYHTGLGPLGHGDMIYGPPEIAGRARDWFDEVSPTLEAIAAAKQGDNSAATVQGTLAKSLYRLLPKARLTVGGIEYGTHHVKSVLASVRADNWLWCHGDRDSAEGSAIRAAIREMFYPSEPAWKVMVFSRSNDVIRQALVGLARA